MAQPDTTQNVSRATQKKHVDDTTQSLQTRRAKLKARIREKATTEESEAPEEPTETLEERRERIRNKVALAYTQSRRAILDKNNLPKDLALACRQHTPAILNRLVELTKSQHGPTAVKACQLILDRAYGRAPQQIQITHGMDRQSIQDAAAAILERRQQLAVAVVEGNLDDEASHASGPEGGIGGDDSPGVEDRVPPEKVSTDEEEPGIS